MAISGKSIQEEGTAWAKALRSVSIREASEAGTKEPDKVTEDEGEGGDQGSRELETQGLSGHQQRFYFTLSWGPL